MKLYFYTANTINGYCNKLGVVVTVSEAEEEGLVCGGTIQVFLEVL